MGEANDFGRGLDERSFQSSVPPDLLPYTTEVFDAGQLSGSLPAQLRLPDGWTPVGAPSLSRVREALHLGMGIVVGNVEKFDFAWLRESLVSATSIECWGPFGGYVGVERLAEAAAARYVITPETSMEVELSELAALEWVLVRSAGLLSATRAPNVREVAIQLSRKREVSGLSAIALSRSIRSLTLPADGLNLDAILSQVPDLRFLAIHDAKGVDLSAVRSTPQLEQVMIADVGEVDLTPLGDLRRLRRVDLNTCRFLSGVGALRQCPSLRHVNIYRADDIPDRDTLLDLELDEFAGVGKAFDRDFEQRAENKSGFWTVDYPKSRRSRG